MNASPTSSTREGFDEAMASALAAEPVLCGDETPVNIAHKDADEHGQPVPGCPHVVTVRTPDERLVWYRSLPARTKVALRNLGLLGAYTGYLVRDDYTAWHQFDDNAAGVRQCVAHLFRHVQDVLDIHPTQQGWAGTVRQVLREAHTAVESAKTAGHDHLDPALLADLRARYDKAHAGVIIARTGPPHLRWVAIEAVRHSTAGRRILPKIEDVARHAGVAPSTVSYVLSGKRSISEATRQRVLRSVRVLGYQPHAGARALASNRSNVVALVIPLRSGIHVPVIMQFAISVVTAARQFDHDVLLLTQDEGVKGLQRVAGTALVDAIIVMDVELQDQRVPVLRELQRPSVLIGFPDDADGLTCIDLDFATTGAVCLRHLADLGHRRVALIGSPPEVYKRETGFATRLADGFKLAAAGARVAATVHPCETTPLAARAVVARLLRDHPDVTAVVVHNEAAVEPLLAAFAGAGRSVPDDLSVVAVCPDELAERVPPRLTSVAIPAEEIGRQAVRLLMTKLNGGLVADETLLQPRLVRRGSTSKPRK